MDFQLPQEASDLAATVARWRADAGGLRIEGGFSASLWRGYLRLGLWRDLREPADLVAASHAFFELGKGGLPGPVLEADLAAQTGIDDVERHLAGGAVVTAVPPGPAGSCVVGWGAVADLVVDLSQRRCSAGHLPPVRIAHDHPHGWSQRTVAWAEPEDVRTRRWILASSLMAGLAEGALRLAVGYARGREQFGRAIGSFQGIQFPLAEAKMLTSGMRLLALDAAWRVAENRPYAREACALAWVGAFTYSRTVANQCHQTLGALGLTKESGLPDLTWGMRWLRSTGASEARALLADHRQVGDGDVPSLILPGFVGA
jgi:acyl-CoA dehydrogenase-like protein